MTLTQAVAIRIKELLKNQGISQYKLIKDTCLDKTTIQTILKNKTKDIRLSIIMLISDAFNMTMDEFLCPELFNKQNIDL